MTELVRVSSSSMVIPSGARELVILTTRIFMLETEMASGARTTVMLWTRMKVSGPSGILGLELRSSPI